MVRILGIVLLLLLGGMNGEIFAAGKGQLVDPMRPVDYQPQALNNAVQENRALLKTQEWTLTTVLISPGRSVAVINGNPLQLGEQLEGYQLVQVDPDKVILKNKQNKLVLHRAGTGLKKISANKKIVKGSNP